MVTRKFKVFYLILIKISFNLLVLIYKLPFYKSLNQCSINLAFFIKKILFNCKYIKKSIFLILIITIYKMAYFLNDYTLCMYRFIYILHFIYYEPNDYVLQLFEIIY